MTGNAILLVHITHSTKTEWEVKFLCEILYPLHVYLLMLHIYVAYTYVFGTQCTFSYQFFFHLYILHT